MTTVETMRGPVDTADLGRTYMHEHVFVVNPDMQYNWPREWGSDDDRIVEAVTKLRALAAQGVKTFVDCTAPGLGRNIPLLAKVAEQVPELNIIVSTGVYITDEIPFTFSVRGPGLNEIAGTQDPEPMVEFFVGDIADGIGDTGVKAGMLKCAIDTEGMTGGVERVMRAVAQAHLQTGTPITVHTHPDSKTGLDVKRVLCDGEGVDPHRVVLGHSGDTTDIAHLRELGDHGFWLGFDRFGVDFPDGYGMPTSQSRNDTLIKMCQLGYADQIVLSHDTNCYMDWMSPQTRNAFLPQWNYLHLGNDVLPYIREHGVTDEQITTMLVDNPRRIFEGKC
ncbi:phosphotriesterase-related protein [Nocardia sp. CDC159]|uniref:Phosphotriesterase-related protein n=1 Tax=Nocardia pulmonis TaxID=2951408 RepID=A0A9X2E769_9NOCA|nr:MULTISPECIES: phosphotriesterase-related protein [Nocardia]MCM6774105.1 phosphotriesterase-related protein [Nocardia pulmonis]MCM6786992.1 phosphotriesterase-related protein [Nocardia sp. CDC159]